MKKDFSQELDRNSTVASLIVEDSISSQFLLFTSARPHEEDFCHVLSLELDENKSLSLQLAHYLFENHLVLNSYRELISQTNISFSLENETPGVESKSLCLHVVTDIVGRDSLDTVTSKASFVSLYELVDKLSVGPFVEPVTLRGIARLINESKAYQASSNFQLSLTK